MTDLSIISSIIQVEGEAQQTLGFGGEVTTESHSLNYDALCGIYSGTPGLAYDKLKAVLETVWSLLEGLPFRGVIFAYDEAQTLSDQAQKEEYPLSLLLDVFQSLQRRDIRFMLALTGLPTLPRKLVEARTYAERMFHTVFLDRLSAEDSREAIEVPIQEAGTALSPSEFSIEWVIENSGGVPYFIQFMCKEMFDIWIQKLEGGVPARAPGEDILRKLDADFFSGRWQRLTNRQRDLLILIALLDRSDEEFTVLEVVEISRSAEFIKAFSASHVNQVLVNLADQGLVYKNRHGKYVLAVPLLDQFILRQLRRDGS
jgi:hypothetical protein